MNKNTLIILNNDGMGKADQDLQHKLIAKYFSLLIDAGTLPGAIAFYTDGVKLVTEGSPVLGQLATMEAHGVHLIVCSTCLDHFGISEKVRAGIVGGMTDIIEAQTRAEKVITL